MTLSSGLHIQQTSAIEIAFVHHPDAVNITASNACVTRVLDHSRGAFQRQLWRNVECWTELVAEGIPQKYRRQFIVFMATLGEFPPTMPIELYGGVFSYGTVVRTNYTLRRLKSL